MLLLAEMLRTVLKRRNSFILFVSTEAVGNKGYMNWTQIKEVEKGEIAYIGNHSHSHDYLTKFFSKICRRY